jgi:hypothetical protein
LPNILRKSFFCVNEWRGAGSFVESEPRYSSEEVERKKSKKRAKGLTFDWEKR